MDIHIDWFSFTALNASLEDMVGESAWNHLWTFNATRTLLESLGIEMFSEYDIASPVPMYPHGVTIKDSGVSIRWGKVNQHLKIDCGGRACTWLHGIGSLYSLLETWGERASRIDIACDFETDMLPKDFVATEMSTRHKTHGFINSSTGQTVYLGSRKSDRMVRVYRYFPPHPREDLLRIEVELKGKSARSFCVCIVNNGVEETMLGELEPYCSHSKLWTPAAIARVCKGEALKGKKNSDKLVWLERQVLPSLVRLEAEGFDVLAWLSPRLESKRKLPF